MKKKLLIIFIILFIIGLGGFLVFSNNKELFRYSFKESNNTEVKDLIPPTIEASDITIFQGDTIDLLSYVKVSDNMDNNVTVTVTGEYNVNKVGDYKITYIATDSSNNSSKKEITLYVKEKTNTNNNVAKRVDFTTSKGFKGFTENGVTYIDNVLVVNKTYSLPSNYGNGLTSETINAFNEMKSVALTEGINLDICSGFRSYNTQKGLYYSYVNRDGKEVADTYSARPGYSEHQSGLAMDINLAGDAFNNTPEAIWLSQNAYKYGFILRYPNGKMEETGYKFESWHYRYVGVELASKLYNNGDWITLEDYFGITSKYSE